MFQDKHGRPVANEAELRNWIAHEKGKVRHPVAGHDLVFTPPKSVSSLWALAPNETRIEIERIVDATVKDTLRWLEENACFTRVGRNGEEQIDTNGFVATLYKHFDSRCGDPICTPMPSCRSRPRPPKTASGEPSTDRPCSASPSPPRSDSTPK